MQNYIINIQTNKEIIDSIFTEVVNCKKPTDKKIEKILRKHPSKEGNIFSKGAIIRAINKISEENKYYKTNRGVFLSKFKMKRVRTSSGVTPVTVLTKPFPCPGKCIFCPNDVRMPKSYLANEPGAQRAESNKFDPYLQTHNRLVAMYQTGHSVAKVELIVLGGTWSSYPKSYQIWFIEQCFEALNNFDKSSKEFIKSDKVKPPIKHKPAEISGMEIEDKPYNKVISKALDYQKTLDENSTWSKLYKSQKINENSQVRCVGLSIETRPDEINKDEVVNIRKLGATKVQIGIQSMDDEVLKLNKRGHDVNKTRHAINLLRKAGFKIQAHYMPNLYGATPKRDIIDFKKVYSDKCIRPDELKIYPCSLIESAELMIYYKKGLWKPYTKEELLEVLVESEKEIPEYTRLTRMVRDIPGTDIVKGNKITNFRQLVEEELKAKNIRIKEIRSREIKSKKVKLSELNLKVTKYQTCVSTEYFLQFVNEKNEIAGFLRLSLPKDKNNNIFKELSECTIIREVHVYGEVLDLGIVKGGKAQHIGLGKNLIKEAEQISKQKGFKKIAVISSIGTREYYKKLGFGLKNYYQVKNLKD